LFKTSFVKLLPYLLLMLIGIPTGHSQTHIYKQFGIDEGLPSSEVYDVHQDKQGHMWFATDKGLSRYNGYEFENFTSQDGLPGNTILDFYPQENGQVWCYEYHSQSLFYFNEVFDGFKLYSHNDVLKNNLNINSVLKSISFDEKGTLYVGGLHLSGYLKINNDGLAQAFMNKITYKTSQDTKTGVNLGFLNKKRTFFYLSHNYSKAEDITLINSPEGVTTRMDFVFLNQDQTVFIDKKLGIYSTNGAVAYYETEQYPIGIKKIDNSAFFVGYYSNGAEIRNASGTVLERFLPDKSVSNFLIDKEGSYWFTTLDDGVFYIKNPKVKVFTEQHISSIVKDNYNDLYLGFENGNIGKRKNSTIINLYNGLGSNAAIVEFDKKKNSVFGYGDGLLRGYSKKVKPLNLGINKLTETFEKSILASSWDGYYTLLGDTIERHQVNNKVQDVCAFGNLILIGTSSGLSIEKNNTMVKHLSSPLLNARIDDIDTNINSKTAYMATQGEGVVVYRDTIYNISKKNGLTNSFVSEVHIENDSTVWACTNTGLNRISFKSNGMTLVNTITKSDGLLSNDINDVEIVNDTVWVATKRGLCFFEKTVIDQKKHFNILSLNLKEVSVNNTRITEQDVKLKHDQNSIDFKIEAISHRSVDQINYFYRLKELDSAWTKTTNRVIRFPSLSPGSYTFEAKAQVFNNSNNLITSYAFRILPPFWKSWWFYSLCFLLVSALVYLFFKVRVLTYNQDVFRELIRLAIKRLKRKEQFYKFRSNGEDFKIPTHEIQYINAQGNYLDIVTSKKTFTIRCKIGDFIKSTPDALEYLRVHRSYIIRIDQVSSKGKNWVGIKDQKIPVGETYLEELDKIHF